MKRRTILAVILALGVLCVAVVAEQSNFTGNAGKVSDGDTIAVMRDGAPVKVRLAGIDCPEKAQPWGSKAKQFTAAAVGNKVVIVKTTGSDRYGRLIGEVITPEGKNLNQELLRAGLAWHYKQYSTDPTLAALETEAREARRGLWVDPQPIAPWQWRKEKRHPK